MRDPVVVLAIVKTAVVAVVLVTVHIGRFAAVFQQLEFKNKARTDAAAV